MCEGKKEEVKTEQKVEEAANDAFGDFGDEGKPESEGGKAEFGDQGKNEAEVEDDWGAFGGDGE